MSVKIQVDFLTALCDETFVEKVLFENILWYVYNLFVFRENNNIEKWGRG